MSTQTIRVFISSTFRDMHAERDHLARVVFPEIRSRCQRRGADFLGFDLRWGVTEEEAEAEGALEICLREIERCRPFFVCLLGDRYGWVPPPDEVPALAFEVLRDAGELPPDVAAHYRRDDTAEPPVYRRRPARRLSAEENGRLARFWESHGLPLAGDSITAREILRGVFEDGYPATRALFYLRRLDPRGFPPALRPDFVERDEAPRRKLADLKERIRALSGALTVREYDARLAGWRDDGRPALDGMDAFGELVLNDLWRGIEAELGRPGPARDAHQRERDHHERFLAQRTRLFLGRQAPVDAVLDDLAREGSGQPLVVTGAAGSGKSALLSECVRRCRERWPEALIVPYFVGSAPGSSVLGALLRSIGETLRRELGIGPEPGIETAGLRRQIAELLGAGTPRSLVLFLDGLDQLDPAAEGQILDWIPDPLAASVRVVASARTGGVLDQLRNRAGADRVLELRALAAADRRELVERFLEVRRKRLRADQLGALLDSAQRPDVGLPLYLRVALEELCLYGDHESLGGRIEQLPPRLPELFAQVLERLEVDHGRELVESVCAWLAVSRSGLLESEIQALLGTDSRSRGTLGWSRLYRSLEPYLEPLEDAPEEGSRGAGLVDFHHQQLRIAACRRYLAMEAPEAAPSAAWRGRHRELASLFQALSGTARGLSELPHHLVHAGLWVELEGTLCDLRFVEAKCAAGMADDLLDDYVAALEALPEARAERDHRRQLDARIDQYAVGLIAYARAWSRWREEGGAPPRVPLPQPPPGPHGRSEAEIEAEAQRIARAPGVPDRIRAFWRFARQEALHLARFAGEPGFCAQQAWNSAAEGPVAATAGQLVDSARGAAPLLLKAPGWRPAWIPRPLCESTLPGKHFAITLDGRRALGGDGNHVALLDLDTGRCLLKLAGHTAEIIAVAITPEGRRGISAGADGTLRHWDLETGACLQAFPAPAGILSIRFTPDCDDVVAADSEGTLHRWDVASGSWLGELDRPADRAWSWSVTPDACRGLTALPLTREREASGAAGDLSVWDLDSGVLRASLEGHDAPISATAITPDGRRAVSGDTHGRLHLWDLDSGRCAATIESPDQNPHDTTVEGLAIAPDGRSVLFSCAQSGPYLWDVERGSSRTLCRHATGGPVAMTPDGRRGVSGGREGLRVWNLESGQAARHGQEWTISLAISADGSQVVSLGFDGVLRVWDIESGRHRETPLASGHDPVSRAAITPDGRRVLHDDRDVGVVRSWDVESGRCLSSWEDWVSGRLALTPDGRLGMNAEGDLHLWDLEAGAYLGKLSHPTGFLDVATTPDGRQAVAAGEASLHVWDLDSRTCLRTLDTGGWSAEKLAISPDGARILAYGGASDEIRLWDLGSGRCLKVIGITTGTFGFCPMAFTPDGRRAVSGGTRHDFDVLQLWDLEAERRLATLPQQAELRCVAVSARHIAYSSGNEVGVLLLPD